MSTIPAKDIVQVNPGVLTAGGSALDMIGLMLTESTRVPIGTVAAFANAADVGTYFGANSTEKSAAAIYFLGFDNSHKKPASLLFAQYNNADVAAYLRGGNPGTLTQVKALAAGTIALTVDGVLFTSASIDLSGATSFSNAASLIEAGFTVPDFTVAYDTVSSSFVFTTTTTGASATITEATAGTLANGLKLTIATGAVLSQGAAAVTAPGTFMDSVVAINQDWAVFTTLFDPDASGNTNKLAFAAWTNLQNDEYGYVCWDTDASPTTTLPATTSLGYLLQQNDDSGTCLIWAATAAQGITKAAFVCGAVASIDFTQTNGRITFAFKSQTGLTADVTNQTIAHNLAGDPQSIGSWGNGYNFYGAYATRNDLFVFLNRGTVSGPFLWFDSYINQIWLNNALQQALVSLLTNVFSLPYNTAGYAMVEAACLDPILAAVNFGAIRSGIPLSESQKAQVNNAAGLQIDDVITQQGYYLQVKDATAQVRAARASPPCTLWYTDGQSIQAITLASIAIQ